MIKDRFEKAKEAFKAADKPEVSVRDYQVAKKEYLDAYDEKTKTTP
jgi:hypothetical protein